MIKKIIENKKTLLVSGRIQDVKDNQIIVEEKKKNGIVTDTLELSDFESFIDSYVKFNIVKAVEGTIQSIDDNGINIYDDKNEETIVISFDDFKPFINSKIRLSVSESNKQDVEEFEE
jgi:hypothetical protein